MNTARSIVGCTGSSPQTSALVFGGDEPAPARAAKTESWNGTNWTEVNDLNVAKYSVGTAGSVLSSIIFGGIATADVGTTESFNGTNWTEVADLNTARSQLAGAGTGTNALGFGGNSPGPDATEQWEPGNVNKSIDTD